MMVHLNQSVEEVGGKVCSAVTHPLIFFFSLMIIRLVHYFGWGNHILVLQSCFGYLRLMYLSYLKYGVRWSEM
jgi:hypothetical protein